MNLELKCSRCKYTYPCEVSNTRVHGSRLSTRCPRCNELSERNVSAFTEEQAFQHGIIYGYYDRAGLMISIARKMAALVNNDTPYMDSKKGKKDELPDI